MKTVMSTNKYTYCAYKKLTYQQRFLYFVLGIAVALFLCLPRNAAAEGKMCTNLKEIHNLDELLYQFYINLDSDCLFTMPGIKAPITRQRLLIRPRACVSVN